MELDPNWEYVADSVMGGVSRGQAGRAEVAGRRAMRLTGQVSTDNGGGFIQMAFDLAQDARGFTGIELDICGNGACYDLRLRTTELTRAWQSFRTGFTAPSGWTTIKVPFDTLEAYRTDATFAASQLRRVGVVAVGREFSVDVAVSGVRLF
nr:CIA30 family protein [Pseudosulfitobacter koreense]